MSDAQTILLTVVVVVLATAALTLYGRRRMSGTWAGRVERAFGQAYPDGLAVGDRVIKAAGAWYPVLES